MPGKREEKGRVRQPGSRVGSAVRCTTRSPEGAGWDQILTAESPLELNDQDFLSWLQPPFSAQFPQLVPQTGFLLFLLSLLALPWFSATEIQGFQATPKLPLQGSAGRLSSSAGAGGSLLSHLDFAWMRPADEQVWGLWPRLPRESSALPPPSADEAVNPISTGST